MIVRVLDSAPTTALAVAIEDAYRRCARNDVLSAAQWEIAVEVGGHGDLFLGGDMDGQTFADLARELRAVRREIEHPRPEDVRAFPLAGTADDPFAPDFFDREPDAWLVSGGGEPTLRVESRDSMAAEMERRKSKLSKPI